MLFRSQPKEAKEILRYRPDFTISEWVKSQMYEQNERAQQDVEAVRKAGLPEWICVHHNRLYSSTKPDLQLLNPTLYTRFWATMHLRPDLGIGAFKKRLIKRRLHC